MGVFVQIRLGEVPENSVQRPADMSIAAFVLPVNGCSKPSPKTAHMHVMYIWACLIPAISDGFCEFGLALSLAFSIILIHPVIRPKPNVK